MVVVNLKGVKAGFDLLPDATVPAKLTSVKWKPSKSTKGAMNANCEFTIDTEAGEPWGGRKAFVTLPTSERGLGLLKKGLIDMGVDPDELEQDDIDLDALFSDLIGAQAYIKITTEQYNNADTNRYAIVSQDEWTG